MKTALIVDDSPLARTVLRRTLFESHISVDEAPSAEVAIEYLRSERPDVIFLDHMMPGMDGFEALQAIKANPDTAMIPVFMYTSQDGQLYMSQARALGAVDVLPKTLKPADVTRILRSHHLTEDSEPRPDIQEAVRDVRQAARGIAETAQNIQEERMLELIRSELQEQRAILVGEMRAHLARIDKEPVMISPPAENRPRPAEISGLSKYIAVATVATTFAAALWFGSLSIYTTRLQREQIYQPTQSTMGPEVAAIEDGASSLALPQQSTITEGTNNLARSKAWVQHYAFGAIPLDDDRAREYEVFFADLKNAGFSGAVELDIFEGRFCLNFTSEGSYELAPLNQPAINCDRIGTATETVLSTQQSVLFSNMMAVAGRDGQLRIETVFHGSTLPIVDYPILDYGVTAGEWNAAATYNQRVALRLVRDQFDARTRFDARTSRIAELGAGDTLDRIVADLVR